MSIIVKFYGDLKRKISLEDEDNGIPKTLEIKCNNLSTILDILENFNINEEEISHIFVNGNLCKLDKSIKDGDRVGIFPRKMGIIFLEILPRYR
ncbi:MAG: MoaD/ThiS family protein [Promethearchaeota archaeon]